MIQVLQRAAGLLDRLDRADGAGLALGELARESGLKAPTARSVLKSLAELGFVRQDAATRAYFLGPRAFGLGRWNRFREALAAAAAPALERFRDETGETVLLALYDRGRRNTLVGFESHQAVRVGAPTGLDTRFHTTATGRLLLALLPAAERAALLARLGLPAPGEWPGAQDEAGLNRALARLRAARECRLDKLRDMRVLAVPLETGDEATAAVGTYYPLGRDKAGRADELAATLRRTAEAVRTAFEQQWK